MGGENQGGRGVFGFEAVFALVGLIERSFHEDSLEQLDALLDPNLVTHAPVPMEQGAEAFKLGLSSSGDGPAI